MLTKNFYKSPRTDILRVQGWYCIYLARLFKSIAVQFEQRAYILGGNIWVATRERVCQQGIKMNRCGEL